MHRCRCWCRHWRRHIVPVAASGKSPTRVSVDRSRSKNLRWNVAWPLDVPRDSN